MHHVLRSMLSYKAWANERLFRAVAGLDEDALHAPQPIKFGSLIKTLQHVYDMDVVWRAHLMGAEHSVGSRVPTAAVPLHTLRFAQAEIDVWFLAFGASQTPDDLNRHVAFRFLDGTEGVMTVGDILIHVVHHSTYHRGHIADMMYHAGVAPPVTDYPVFVRDASEA